MTTRRTIIVIFLSAVLGALCGCDTHLPAITLSGDSMGTTFSIVIVEPSAFPPLDDLQSQILSRLEHIEDIASTYRDSSEIGQFNLSLSTDWVIVSAEFCYMVSRALLVARETDGAFDITIGPLVNLWGFGPGGAVSSPPIASDIEQARSNIGYAGLNADCERGAIKKSIPAMQIDLSGWAKGYAVDRLAELLDTMGMNNYLIEIGGEIKVKGHNAKDRQFAIAIENPLHQTEDQLSIIHVSDTGVATSGDYRNYFVFEGTQYSHTIDPRTGRPIAHNLSAVTVIHRSTAYADAIATALLVLGPDEGMTLANELGIAAYFAISTSTGLDYRASDAFSSLPES